MTGLRSVATLSVAIAALFLISGGEAAPAKAEAAPAAEAPKEGA